MRIADYGVQVGSLPHGERNKITDVPGVRVGHATIHDERHHTGVTVILPCADNMFKNKLTAASFVLNGFGKTQGLVQIDELGTLETPIALTNTLNVGKVHDALVSYMAARCAEDRVEMCSINPVVGECNDAALNAITDRPVEERHVLQAIETARAQAPCATASRAASARPPGCWRSRAAGTRWACWCRATTARSRSCT